jgi:hypothetical protein
MARKAKTGKITKAPSGISFMYAPPERQRTTPHAWSINPEHHCENGGVVYTVGRNRHPGVNRPDALIYGCTGCEWNSPSGDFEHEPSVRQILPRKRPVVKKQAQKKMPVDLRDAVRAEVRRRMEILKAEREKFPPSLLVKRVKITKGKNKGKIKTTWISNPQFTNAMREHMHRFYVSSEEIHDALKAGRKLPDFPVKA